LAKVLGHFSGPGHAPAGLLRVLEAQDFGVQGLAREIDAGA
jgi:hypothetical protein